MAHSTRKSVTLLSIIWQEDIYLCQNALQSNYLGLNPILWGVSKCLQAALWGEGEDIQKTQSMQHLSIPVAQIL